VCTEPCESVSVKQKIDWYEKQDTFGIHLIQKLNSHIERVRTLIADAYHELVQQRKTVSVDAVKSLFLGTAEDTVTLRKLVEYHNRETAHKLLSKCQVFCSIYLT